MKRIILIFFSFLIIGLAACERVDKGPFDFSPEFELACSDIGMDTSQIYNWKSIADWANGKRFQFVYKRHNFLTYMNYDNTVNSINLDGIKIYEQGYEPYQVDDYLVDEYFAETLIPYAEENVKLALTYPLTADFSLLNWSYGRQDNLYQLQSSVKAKNALGVESSIPFTIIFDVSSEETLKCVYLDVNGAIIENNMPTSTDRKRIDTNSNIVTEDGTIRLIYGELGLYGKQDKKYPEYIDYFIPVGKYNVLCNSKTGIVMIIDDKTNDEISRVTLSAGQSDTFEIQSNQHIELTMYSDAALSIIS
ncbi:MAG: hypothetical protein LBM93_11300 [Oscillospiraceae bacterium]|jgi:hypothetical protein|nr:hypothetical protein [Oscillospiraceae bacterium]